MKQKTSGIILMTVLIVLMILSLLIFTSMQTGLLEMKMSHLSLAKHKIFYAAEKSLRLAENSLLANNKANLANTKIEKLIDLPCSQLPIFIKSSLIKNGVTIYRITVNAKQSNGRLKQQLQTTFAIPMQSNKQCVGRLKLSKFGRLSWREL